MDAPFTDNARKHFDKMKRINNKKTYEELVIENDQLKKQVKKLKLCAVGKSFTVKEIVSELEDSDHLDDAIMFFKESE